MLKHIIAGCLVLSALQATDYGFLEYYFVDQENPIHIAGRYRGVGEANFRTHKYGHVDYADAYGAVFYSQFINPENSLTWGVGYNYLKFDWEKNPRFHETDFNYGVASLGYVSTSLEKWRWIVNAGMTVDSDHFNFGQTAVYHGMLWGRYHFAEVCGAHVGVVGWYGVENGYTLPIFGFDWRMTPQWTANFIYPVNFSINYAFNEYWSTEVAYSGFGGPYKYPRRAYGGEGSFHNPIFMVYSRGVDLNLRYRYAKYVRLDFGAGWNFGGWILIKNHDNHHSKYYNFNSAPYGQCTVAFTF